jgi:hypothetical protein
MTIATIEQAMTDHEAAQRDENTRHQKPSVSSAEGP